jgi:site-specific recombinase
LRLEFQIFCIDRNLWQRWTFLLIGVLCQQANIDAQCKFGLKFPIISQFWREFSHLLQIHQVVSPSKFSKNSLRLTIVLNVEQDITLQF